MYCVTTGLMVLAAEILMVSMITGCFIMIDRKSNGNKR